MERVLQLRPDLVRSAWIVRGDDDPNVYRVEMSCGHTVDPISLTEYCRIRISEGHFKLHCPALIDDTDEVCGKEWCYVEVCRKALLSVEERQDFEEKLAILAASSYCEYKQCPRCGSYVGRKDETNISVTCSVCTAIDGIPFEFCWQCMKKWKGPAPRSDKCDNEGCINIQLETLKNCDTKSLPYSNIQNCPIIRACPTCGLLIEHKEMCKYVVCIRCHVEFCFACLNTKAICSESSEYSLHCAIPVAPRQTSIPVWNRTQVQISNSTSDSDSIGSPSPSPSPPPSPSPSPPPSPTLNHILTAIQNPTQSPVQNPPLDSNSNCTIL
ncbi:E3 ubiquitin-protein ligase DDB_G0292642-like isoform X2 [Hemitrygon akajei]|uniref:E3 ubiquitin-protein ligase DDB_G0292642-like isoform X2 n=1 Tax=Hemitrygon akajei TaxID=2704970 RepID=UPI003BF9F9A2